MDFNSLIKGALPTLVANSSRESNSSADNSLPDSILDTLTPLLGFQFNPLLRLFMVFYNMFGSHIGIDPSYILTAVGFVWAANKLWEHLYMTFYSLSRQYFMANVQISSNDDIYCHMMKWLAAQPSLVDSRSLTAETASMGAWDDEDENELMVERVLDDSTDGYFNFSTQEAKAAPRFTPSLGMHSFWFRGRYFSLYRKQEALYDAAAASSGMAPFKDKEILVLSCFGRSPEPIKQLLQHAKEQFYIDHQAKTTVRRPANQAMRRYGSRHNWQQVANRPVRPMSTVVLDDEQKIRVLADMNEYLHPATPRWYANRGIPLRRGYLFHGPPGTGKTSLSFALAGVFGLDIYVISLLDPSLTEEDLLALFTALPRRCVVLLEDIDTAGLQRAQDPASSASSSSSEDAEEQDDKKAKKPRHKSKKDWKVSDLARELKRHGSGDGADKKGISLSGLLNAIDGVASHEGRVLIMTTNKPETLDEALIRPGRVDLQVAFTNATQAQARELFVRMYEPDSGTPNPASSPLPPLTPFSDPPLTPFSTISGATEVDAEEEDPLPFSPAKNIPAPLNLQQQHKPPSSSDENETDKLHPAELAQIAAQFAAKIPGGQFSPAELQGFLLKRKKTPRRALGEVEGWVAGMMVLKMSKTKVLQVQ